MASVTFRPEWTIVYDYDTWAKNLLEELYYAPEDQRVSLLEEHLKKAAKRGYVEGSDFGWAAIQDSMGCQHDFQEMNPFRDPSTMVCKNCGEYK